MHQIVDPIFTTILMDLDRKGSSARMRCTCTPSLLLQRIPSNVLFVLISLVVLGNCAYLGFRIGELIGENYNAEDQVIKKIEVEVGDEYAQLLKYPPPPLRRSIRSSGKYPFDEVQEVIIT